MTNDENVFFIYMAKEAKSVKLIISIFIPFLVFTRGVQEEVEVGAGLITNKPKHKSE